MKIVQHLMLVASLVLASCQCAVAADQSPNIDMAMEECHDVQVVEVMSDDCCEQEAATAKTELPQKPAGLDSLAVIPNASQAPVTHLAAFGFERRRGPPRCTTPTEKFDCLRI